jgi:hypothetical protein
MTEEYINFNNNFILILKNQYEYFFFKNMILYNNK